jgi:hypothetical protein
MNFKIPDLTNTKSRKEKAAGIPGEYRAKDTGREQSVVQPAEVLDGVPPYDPIRGLRPVYLGAQRTDTDFIHLAECFGY